MTTSALPLNNDSTTYLQAHSVDISNRTKEIEAFKAAVDAMAKAFVSENTDPSFEEQIAFVADFVKENGSDISTFDFGDWVIKTPSQYVKDALNTAQGAWDGAKPPLSSGLVAILTSGALNPDWNNRFYKLHIGIEASANAALPIPSTAIQYLVLNEDAPNKYVETYFSVQAQSGGSIDPDVAKTYFAKCGEDDVTSEHLLSQLTKYQTSSGTFNAQLMDAMRTLVTGGTDHAISELTNPPPWTGAQQANFDGWPWAMMTALAGAASAGTPIDQIQLARLDGENAWAGAYVRWAALNYESDHGQNLNTEYLSSLAKSQPEAAIAICEKQLNTGLQTNLELQDWNLVGENGRYTPTDYPRVRVSLAGMGAGHPDEGDMLHLVSSDGTFNISHPITHSEWLQGWIDIVPASSIPNGTYTLTSYYEKAATTTSPAYRSPPGLALKIGIAHDLSPSVVTYENRIVVDFTDPTGLFQKPDSSLRQDFTFWVDGTPFNPTTVTFDGANARLLLDFDPAFGTNAKLSNGYLTYNMNYRNDLSDGLGIKIPSFNAAPVSVGALPQVTGTVASTLQDEPALTPRALDIGAWNIYAELNPNQAAVWMTAYERVGLVGNSASTSTRKSIATLAFEKFMNRVASLDDQLQTSMKEMDDHTEEINALNILISKMTGIQNGMSDSSGSNDKVGTSSQYSSTLAAEINTAIDAVKGKPTGFLSKTSGHVTTETTKADLAQAINSLSAVRDAKQNWQQTELIRLKQVLSSMDIASTMASSMIDKFMQNLQQLASKI
jgi:hypothetical protein